MLTGQLPQPARSRASERQGRITVNRANGTEIGLQKMRSSFNPLLLRVSDDADHWKLTPTTRNSSPLILVSPEPDRVAFFVNSVKPTMMGIDYDVEPFRLAFEWIEPKRLVLYVHLGAG